MNNDKPRKLTNEQREQLRVAKAACPNNLNGSDAHYCTQCSTIPQQKPTLLGQADTSNYISVHPDHVAGALGLTRGKPFNAVDLLDLLSKLRDGAVTDSNRIGELSTQLDQMTKDRDHQHNRVEAMKIQINEMTGKYNAALEEKNRKDEKIIDLKDCNSALIEERDKAQEDLRKALAERNQARAAFRAAAQRLDFETICDLFCTMELPQ